MIEKEANIISNQMAKVESYLLAKEIPIDDFQLLLIAYKKERLLRVFAKSLQSDSWTEIVKYDFCTFSGTLGPKVKEGDKQIPEGFYKVNKFNPKSNFHLSLGLNYPTKRDLKIADKESPGSDIFIHGGCRSVGCLAITDEKIEELYTLAKFAKGEIDVIILPFEMNDEAVAINVKAHPKQKAFWKELFLDWKEMRIVILPAPCPGD